MEPNEFEVVLETTPDIFENWLRDYLHQANSSFLPLTFATDSGEISIRGVKRADWTNLNARRLAVHGAYRLGRDPRWLEQLDLEEIILFVLSPISPNRVKITARCSQPVVAIFFRALYEDIVEHWFDSSSPLHDPEFGESPPKKSSRRRANQAKSPTGLQDGTLVKLEKLRARRRDEIKEGKLKTKTDACHLEGIDPKTVRRHDPILWKNWDNPEWSDEESEAIKSP